MDEFPPALSDVPQDDRVVEAFGWTPSGCAGLFLLVGALGVLQPAPLGTFEKSLVAASLGLALVLAVYEFKRRKNPRVLVRPGLGPRIGIYRAGRLQRSVEVEQSQIFIRHPTNTWGPLIALVMAVVGSLTFLVPGPFDLSVSDRAMALIAAVSFGALAASHLKARFRCEEVLLPYPGTAAFERVLVPKQAVKRLFSRPT